jgi:hypothetical protein
MYKQWAKFYDRFLTGIDNRKIRTPSKQKIIKVKEQLLAKRLDSEVASGQEKTGSSSGSQLSKKDTVR